MFQFDDKKSYVALVLDCSGSMERCKQATLSGFNEQIQTLIDVDPDEGDTYVSLFTFNSKVKEHYINESACELDELTDEQYVTRGNTAMLDAVGHAIDKLCKTTDIEDDDISYLVVIMSDGQENASKNYTRQQIADKIKKLQETKRWTFTYLGANQDLSQVAESLNLYYGNCASYSPCPRDTELSLHQTASGIANFKMMRALDETSMKNFYSDKDEITEIK